MVDYLGVFCIAADEATSWRSQGDDPSSVSTGDHLSYQYVLQVSPPDEDIILQMPVSRLEVHLDCLFSHRKAEERVGKDQVVPYAGS
ncbi:unnamed protein product [Schistocephalus solidus]|uniref:Uncharacterized protein n=1 Tax=Schistocephalus solidus TaxID=70667 RepID=A0A183TGI7_SCHSO|nr:unnamed protein product [Schistocephalus solidus]